MTVRRTFTPPIQRGRPPAIIPLLFACAYTPLTLVVATGHGGRFPGWGWLPVVMIIAGAAFLTALIIGMVRRRPLRNVLGDAPTALALQLAAGLVVAAYVTYRPAMQHVVPFWADSVLAKMDWWLHFGRHPYTLLPTWPPLTYLIDEVYGPAWFALTPVVIAFWAWGLRGRERARAFLAFFMTWGLLGTVFGTLMSSAGPVYAERLGITDAYEPLIRYLRALNLRATAGHEVLWLGYVGERIPYGITAMPSLHVAFPFLTALTVWHWTWLRVSMLMLAVLILFGSVHLGWHYAIDGYVSIVGVLLVWRATDRLVPSTDDEPVLQRSPTVAPPRRSSARSGARASAPDARPR